MLITERLALRPISDADVETLFSYWTDPEVMEFLVLEPFADLDEARRMVALLNGLPEQGEGRRWAITDKNSGVVMGTCGFHSVKPEHRRAEIGYEMGRAFWGRGFMSEALQALLAHCFEQEGFNRVEAFVNVGNTRSFKVLQRAGFQEEGTLRQYEFARGRFIGQVIWSLLRQDWDVARAACPCCHLPET